MFYTEMHTERYKASRRKEATKECQDLKDCLEEIRMKCGVLSGEKKCLRKADIVDWLRDELEKIRDCTSIILVCTSIVIIIIIIIIIIVLVLALY